MLSSLAELGGAQDASRVATCVEQLIGYAIAVVKRALGAALDGVLTKEDVARYSKLSPTKPDGRGQAASGTPSRSHGRKAHSNGTARDGKDLAQRQMN